MSVGLQSLGFSWRSWALNLPLIPTEHYNWSTVLLLLFFLTKGNRKIYQNLSAHSCTARLYTSGKPKQKAKNESYIMAGDIIHDILLTWKSARLKNYINFLIWVSMSLVVLTKDHLTRRKRLTDDVYHRKGRKCLFIFILPEISVFWSLWPFLIVINGDSKPLLLHHHKILDNKIKTKITW